MLAEHNVRTGFFEAEQFAAVKAKLSAPLQPVAEFAYLARPVGSLAARVAQR